MLQTYRNFQLKKQKEEDGLYKCIYQNHKGEILYVNSREKNDDGFVKEVIDDYYTFLMEEYHA